MSKMLLQVEEDYLKYMIAQNKRDDETVEDLVRQGKDCAWWYEQDGDESHLTTAHGYAHMAKSIKEGKFTIKEIRRQREHVQWLRKKTINTKQH